MKLKLADEFYLEAEVDRVGRHVRVSVSATPEDGPRITTRFTMGVDGAADLADVIRAVVEEVRALPPDGWRACTEPPAPGTRVRWWKPGSSIDMRGVVLTERASDVVSRICVTWTETGKTGEPLWDQLCVEEPAT